MSHQLGTVEFGLTYSESCRLSVLMADHRRGRAQLPRLCGPPGPLGLCGAALWGLPHSGVLQMPAPDSAPATRCCGHLGRSSPIVLCWLPNEVAGAPRSRTGVGGFSWPVPMTGRRTRCGWGPPAALRRSGVSAPPRGESSFACCWKAT